MSVSGFFLTDENNEVVSISVDGAGDLAKAHIKGYTRKTGVAVKAHEDKRPNRRVDGLSVKKPNNINPDYGHMRFAFRDYLGNLDILHITKDNCWAGGGPDQRVPMSLANYVYHSQDGTEEKRTKFKAAIRSAYNSCGGNASKVLAAIRAHTKTGNSWSLLSHDQADMNKAHIKEYRHKDGSIVKEHDDKRPSAKPKQNMVRSPSQGTAPARTGTPMREDQRGMKPASNDVLNKISKKYSDIFRRKENEWATGGKKIPASALEGVPIYPWSIVYGENGRQTPLDNFDPEFIAHGHRGFILEHPFGERTYIDTEGYDYARYQAPIDDPEPAGDTQPEDDHPAVVGQANGMVDGDAEHCTGFEFADQFYVATGRDGKSNHDQTPVREFESDDTDEIVWLDGAGRVHANSNGDVESIRERTKAKPHAPSAKDKAVMADEYKKAKYHQGLFEKLGDTPAGRLHLSAMMQHEAAAEASRKGNKMMATAMLSIADDASRLAGKKSFAEPEDDNEETAIQKLEDEGMSRSDAQGVYEASQLNKNRAKKKSSDDPAHTDNWDKRGDRKMDMAGKKEAFSGTPHAVGSTVRVTATRGDRGLVGKVTRVIKDSGIGGEGVPAYYIEGAGINPYGHGEVEPVANTKKEEPVRKSILFVSDKLAKSHVSAYTRKNGSFVRDHERQIEAHGVRGIKSTPWRKTFKNQAEFDKWLEKNEGNVEVHATRDVD